MEAVCWDLVYVYSKEGTVFQGPVKVYFAFWELVVLECQEVGVVYWDLVYVYSKEGTVDAG